MITQLTGTLAEIEPTEAVLDVNGVGYAVTIPVSTYDQLPAADESVTLYTHLAVREDALQLYGFYTREERRLFRIVTTVSGVGPRLALNALSCMPVQTFCSYVLEKDVKALSRINGIGRRVAERFTVELQDSIQELSLALSSESSSGSSGAAIGAAAGDAVTALETLGYKSERARETVGQICNDHDGENKNTETIIREALQLLNS